MTISTVKTSLCDILVQKVIEKRKNIDWRRNAAFSTFGFFYLGGVQYGLYVKVFGRLFPGAASFAAKSLRDKVKDVSGSMNVLKQVILDQVVHHPLLYFPAFYCTKELVMSSSSSSSPDFIGCLKTYRENMWEDLIALWEIWVPSALINFAFMPMWGRIPWVAATSGLWTCVLSAMRGGSISDAEEIMGGAVTGGSVVVMKRSFDEFFLSPMALDKNMSHICISASGIDKVGWVALLTNELAANGGNVTHSKMLRMGSEFAILMHVSVDPKLKKQLVVNLLSNEDLEPLHIRTSSLKRRVTGTYAPAVLGFRIHSSGDDRPGMLATVAETVCGMGLNIENINTEIKGRQDGTPAFHITIDCCTSQDWDEQHRHDMIKVFKSLEKKLKLDTMDIQLVPLNLEE
eukprot:CAMPEP_0172499684 /NCGR_PEP_ID=MMETSP1066-20121228/129657_1 /TAXON_ID=671091 /ORGANISM="Coscinodiscus wailesii, Strain CCMP2513" /LENGTH=401 /DNA_ID=CAMNT_0013273565 /DNA_START=289 /DNA_END=1494 /DNA_ORIENTATION=+